MKALLLLVLMVAGTAQAAAPDYVRYRESRGGNGGEDAGGARLEVAIRTLTLPSGQVVDLIGVVHIADEAYYQELNRRFAAYDSVLFELVGDPRAVTAAKPADTAAAPAARRGTVGSLQGAAADHLRLRFQLDVIDYTGRNMVHADATAEQFAQMQAERGENVITLFSRAMQAQMASEMSGATRNELDTFALLRILMSRDSAAEFKRVLAKMLAQSEVMTAAMEARGQTAILSGRNAVAVAKAREVLADRKQRRIAMFYGAAHMVGIEAALVAEARAVRTSEEWLTAWRM